jgi:hypothetical protein
MEDRPKLRLKAQRTVPRAAAADARELATSE